MAYNFNFTVHVDNLSNCHTMQYKNKNTSGEIFINLCFSIMPKKALSLYVTVVLMFMVVYFFSSLPGTMMKAFGYHSADNSVGFNLFAPDAWFSFFDAEVDNKASISWSNTADVTQQDVSYEVSVASMVDSVRFEEVSRSPNATEKEHYKYLIGSLFSTFPEAFTAPLDDLTFRVDSKGSRGLAGSHSMILRTEGVSDLELLAVATHELGHVVDLGALTGVSGLTTEFKDGHKEVYSDDVSLSYYRISWQDDMTKKEEAVSSDFVSGYAMSDPFEDFAESFLYYVVHGKEFKRLSVGSDALRAKYNFMKYDLFEGKEFLDNEQSYLTTSLSKRPWDATKEPFLMEDAMHGKR